MFGSLVIIFPTPHEGGALLLRQCGHEWIFDSDQALVAEEQPSVSYVAFSSDVEHEVSPVTSGHRITLTYDLYFDDGGPVSANDAVSEHLNPPQLANKGAFREAFMALLENPEFLADGGTLAFGLRHVYPCYDTIKSDPKTLKGSDAFVYQVVRALGYEPVLYLRYRENDFESAIIERELSLQEVAERGEYGILDIVQREGGILVTEEGKSAESDPRYGPPEKLELVAPMTEFNRKEMCYGASLHLKGIVNWGYGDVCMVVRIGKAGDRLAYPTVAELDKAYEKRQYW